MDAIMALAEEHHLLVVEDAAHAVDSYYKNRPLGGIGHLAAFSFHETKNINCGEGGMLVVNDERFISRAEIIWEKGTNRAEFYRGMVNKYGWCDLGSSFLPSELNAAFLWAQLEQMGDIQAKRRHIWERYDEALRGRLHAEISLPSIPDYATNNYHMYYLLCPSLEVRTRLMNYLKNKGVQATFHYLPLHSSVYYKDKHDGRPLPNCDRYADTLVRLPLFYEMTDEEQRSYDELWDKYLELQADKEKTEKNKKLIEVSLMRQWLADKMIPKTIELVKKCVTLGRKVVVFCAYDNEINKLLEEFGDICVYHNGKLNEKKRI
jgi:dTDP-4-amino-4,6-dideoxygalactose transaminase